MFQKYEFMLDPGRTNNIYLKPPANTRWRLYMIGAIQHGGSGAITGPIYIYIGTENTIYIQLAREGESGSLTTGVTWEAKTDKIIIEEPYQIVIVFAFDSGSGISFGGEALLILDEERLDKERLKNEAFPSPL